MSRFWSDVIHRLTPYIPGEQPAHANPVKLNTNENPYPPSPRVVDAIRRELDQDTLRKYPDPESCALRQTVARYHGLSSEQVFVGNGSDEVLAHVFQALLKHDRPVRFPDISYSFYPVYARLYGVAFEAKPLDRDFTINIDDYAPSGGPVLLPNPNAPTGLALRLTDIARLLTENPGFVVVIDEAYVDFGAESAVTLIPSHPNLLVVQTTSKARSLAGMRVGFALGNEALIHALTRVKDSFNSYPIDRLAQVAAVAAYEDDAWFRMTCAKVVKSRERLAKGLRAQGFEVTPSTANFVFARHPARDATTLTALLRAQGIFVRHFDLPRINQHLRISVGTDDECDALLRSLRSILATYEPYPTTENI
ncbi:histidinol-phosphate transaminase [Paraburkholderia elongata]|uniref:Histidinol-phosphate aminotransferase n=1 Tax=Paraburkholderia elongata TaxID=2675747 RepID=A0A972SHT2_9BURK|nr:histidinol-phosphate transaminase [Paraburkholderia elongata]NPT55334.1 histidinol-phosphate transaminase [Paraburkholderia elongata]